jgi:hypothetical protein
MLLSLCSRLLCFSFGNVWFGIRIFVGYGNRFSDTFGYISRDLWSFHCIVLDTHICCIRLDTLGYVCIRLDTLGYAWIRLDTSGYFFLHGCFGCGTSSSLIFNGCVSFLQKPALKISLTIYDLRLFCKGVPPWNLIGFIWFAFNLQGVPLRLPLDLHGLASILQGVVPRISLNFVRLKLFCKGRAP